MFLCPWNFPDRNTGVGCHFLLQGYNIVNRVNNTVLYSLKYVRGIDCKYSYHTKEYKDIFGDDRYVFMGFKDCSVEKKSSSQCRRLRFHPWVGKIPLGVGNGNLLQYSCLENSMDRGAWRATDPWSLKESDRTKHAPTQS